MFFTMWSQWKETVTFISLINPKKGRHVDPTNKNVWLGWEKVQHFFPLPKEYVDTLPVFRSISYDILGIDTLFPLLGGKYLIFPRHAYRYPH